MISKAVKRLMFEAYRRNCAPLDYSEKYKPLRQRWLGLGTAAAYRPATDENLMVFFDGRVPPRGCMGWLVLTDKGILLLEELSEEFANVMAERINNPSYRDSYLANYMLAGGLVQ